MIFKQRLVNTHSTILTMSKVLPAANTTEPTIGTVIWLFLIAHPKVTNGTVIFPKLCPAIDAVIRFGSLFGKAFIANDFTYGESIELMVFGRTILGEGGGHGGCSEYTLIFTSTIRWGRIMVAIIFAALT
mmetsp:Transcript_20981/g.30037  ORF Transcript_20981/g.30037 Transcript_20981/m.30037 type:complete len:130 (-) Transcript_20981:330-719(-)